MESSTVPPFRRRARRGAVENSEHVRTQVGIVGAGPAGLLLGRMLSLAGIDTVILEARSRPYVEERIRAGTLEHPTVQLLGDLGLDERMRRQGSIHHGFELRFDGRRQRIATAELTGGQVTVMYGQQEIVKDAIAMRVDEDAPLHFEVSGVQVRDADTDRPQIDYVHGGREHTLSCDFVAGCDGFHGVCRRTIPANAINTFAAEYPFAWLGVLATVAPSTAELIYAAHPKGFALHSMRSPSLSRFYLQVSADERLDSWADERIWEELHTRLGTQDDWTLSQGPIVQRGITAMRSFVCEPMQYGRLLLAGDAAHIVPPTAAKGLNLAAGDARLLAECLLGWYEQKSHAMLERYSKVALRRVWWAQEFSRAMTWLLHHEPGDTLGARLRSAQLEHLCASTAAATDFSEQYVGLPFMRATERELPAAA
jgi:p-hydroxybenzoate 3-monooxygenase